MSAHSNTPVTRDYFLKPGFIYLPAKPTAISTVLGSSVAVCLYDRSLSIGGMNHFLFPYAETKENATAQYGNIAILTLIQMLTANGVKSSRMEAQIFGGAYNVNRSQRDIGSDNFKAARRILKNKRIKIVSEDVGGELGRKIVFNTHTCEIVILKVGRLRSSDWYPYPPER